MALYVHVECSATRVVALHLLLRQSDGSKAEELVTHSICRPGLAGLCPQLTAGCPSGFMHRLYLKTGSVSTLGVGGQVLRPWKI